MADKVYKGRIGGEFENYAPTPTTAMQIANRQFVLDNAGGVSYSDVEEINNVNPNSVSAVLPLSPLTLETYDGSGQSTHPSVVYIPEGLSGYKYWMAHTPYPAEDQTKENPSILASNDRITWVTPAGLVNPIVAPPAADFWADVNLIQGYDGKLYCYYLGPGGCLVTSSVDGITWSASVVVFDGTATGNILSPSIIKEDGKYIMYYIVNTTGYLLKRWTSNSPTGGFATIEDCTVSNMPASNTNWHMEVRKYGEEYHLFDTLRNGNLMSIYFGRSDDGLNFTLANQPLFKSEPTINWTIARLYKSSFILLNDNKYAGWVSAVSNTNEWRIGYTEVAINGSLVETTNASLINQTNRNPNGLYLTESKLYKGNYLLNWIPEFALSNETSDLVPSTTVPVVTYRFINDFLLHKVVIQVTTAPTGSTLTVDVKKNGTSIFSTLPTIDAAEFTSETAAVAQVLTTTTFLKNDKIEFFINSVGNTVAGKGLKISLL